MKNRWKALAVAAVSALTLWTAPAAFADDRGWRGDGWRGDGWRDDGWRGDDWRAREWRERQWRREQWQREQWRRERAREEWRRRYYDYGPGYYARPRYQPPELEFNFTVPD